MEGCTESCNFPPTVPPPLKEKWNLWQEFSVHCNYQQNKSVLNDSNIKNKLYTNVSCIHKVKGFKHMVVKQIKFNISDTDSAHILSLVL